MNICVVYTTLIKPCGGDIYRPSLGIVLFCLSPVNENDLGVNDLRHSAFRFVLQFYSLDR